MVIFDIEKEFLFGKSENTLISLFLLFKYKLDYSLYLLKSYFKI